MKRHDPYFSVDEEPALRGGAFVVDPAEREAARVPVPPSEIEAIRDSVMSEPHLAARLAGRPAPGLGPASSTAAVPPPQFHAWLEDRRRRCSRAGNLGATALAALAGGPFALVGALLVGQEGMLAGLYVILFGPVIEELLKQSGMVYLIEHKPYRIFAGWQFVAAAVVSALVFASVENLLYIHVYVADAEEFDLAAFARFRWVVCTTLHVSCSAIASLGLIRVWKRQIASGAPADLSYAFPLFVVAIAVHGLYNLTAVLLGDMFSSGS